jgi:phenylalanyl-tRNA synthetase alpha chain
MVTATLTSEGKNLLKEDLSKEYLDQVTPELIASGEWKTKQFRHYDFSVPPPRYYGSRRHPLAAVINDMRSIWLSMGFEEITGPWVETAFWCMDSMWIPQDHPARDMQDTFYLPYEGTLPHALAKKVAKVHEDGGNTGSTGYGYPWNPHLAQQLRLRTHTTAATFRTLGSGVQPPKKCFCVGRIFRNEAIDATHLPEFHQIEGFIMDKGLTLRDLMGYIAEFYRRMGITKIKFRPTYNPYTEPSMEALGWSEELGRYVELINSGMFRPESLEPYGIKVPVIAWGLGVERLAMMLYKEKSIRNMLGATADLQWLRQYKTAKVMI